MIDEKTIVLCLDIDQTIVSHASPYDVVDYNGSDDYDDATVWVNFLTELKAYCEARSFRFFVQLISAKALPDYLVVNVFQALHAFLLPLNKKGNVIRAFDDPTKGYVLADEQLHFMLSRDNINRWMPTANAKEVIANNDYIITDEELLPPIHLCKYNRVIRKQFDMLGIGIGYGASYSKAMVMKYISTWFEREIPASNLFLFDDQFANTTDAEQSGFQGVLAENMFELEKGTKAERAIACREILEKLKNKIQAHVNSIFDQEISEEEQNCKSTAPSLSAIEDRHAHEIHHAAKAGNLKRVEELVAQDADLTHTVDAFNQTPLSWAAFKGHHDVVSFFIGQGASVNQVTQLPDNGSCQKNHNNTPLDWAIRGKNLLTIGVLLQANAVSNKYSEFHLILLMIKANNITQVTALVDLNPSLLNQFDQYGYTLLHYAGYFGHVDIARYLIGKGADLNARTVQVTGKYALVREPNQSTMDIACKYQHDLMVAFLFEAGAFVTPAEKYRPHAIHSFVRLGRLRHVQALITRYPELADVEDDMNQTPLLWAAAVGHDKIAGYLVSLGVRLDVHTEVPDDVHFTDECRERRAREEYRTPLDWAMAGNHMDTILLLIQAKARVNHRHVMINDRPLRAWIKDNDMIRVNILIYCNKRLLNNPDQYGYTPLHYAAIHGHLDLVYFLLEAGADINMITAPASVDVENSMGHRQMTAMGLWSKHNPERENPFIRIQLLEKRKTELVTYIVSQIPGAMYAWYAGLQNEQTILEDLQQKVLQARFNSIDPFDKTAEDVLIAVRDAWIEQWDIVDTDLLPPARKQTAFFSPWSHSEKPAINVLQQINRMLCASSNNQSATSAAWGR